MQSKRIRQWEKLKDLFDKAVSLSGREREELFRSISSGDPELCAELKHLIEQHEAAGNFLQGDKTVSVDSFTPGQMVAQRYRVVRQLGRGGMGEVYLAVDTQLGRQVALKFLAENIRNDTVARKRLLAEAKVAASVDHPYICKIYEAGEIEGILFISMEFIEGETLAERISKGGAQSIKEVLQISSEIAEALDKAHQRRLIHRDLKPSNILLTVEGHVKITDFGLAKYLPESGSQNLVLAETLTREGLLLGTPAYMSPEQVRGLQVDARSDLFSFGVILYELLTGEHPFKRSTAATTFTAILTEPPPPYSRQDCPNTLRTIVEHLLAKEPDQRYQSTRELQLDLRQVLEGNSELSSAPPSSSDHADARASDANSLAVLPFSNLSPDKDNEFFSDGLTEELIARIGMIKRLKVISRTSVMQYKGLDLSLRSIARKLGVANILEGSVQRFGSRVRIVARLVKAENEQQIWSEIYDRDVKDIFALQADVCRQICDALNANVTTTNKHRLDRAGSVNPEAYTCYLKGRHFLNKLTPEGVRKGIEYFNEALDHDPIFADAYAGLAKSYAYSGHWRFLPIDQAYSNARAAAKRALQLDGNLAEANTAAGFVAYLYDWAWSTAQRGFQRALELNANDGETHVFYSWYLQAMGRIDKALAEAKSAVNVDPLSPITNTNLGYMLTIIPRYDDAIEQLHKTLEMDPTAVHPRYLIGGALAGQGKFEEAIRMLDHDAMPNHSKPLLAWVHALRGSFQEARQVLEKIACSPMPGAPSAIAVGYLLIGDEENGATWLEQAYRERDGQLMHLRTQPLASQVHSHPKLLEICDRMGLPH